MGLQGGLKMIMVPGNENNFWKWVYGGQKVHSGWKGFLEVIKGKHTCDSMEDSGW